MDHPVLNQPDSPELRRWLSILRRASIQVNKEWADKLGIPQSTAVTCVE